MLLVKTTAGVAEHRESEVVNDAVDAFACDWRLVGPGKRFSLTPHVLAATTHFSMEWSKSPRNCSREV